MTQGYEVNGQKGLYPPGLVIGQVSHVIPGHRRSAGVRHRSTRDRLLRLGVRAGAADVPGRRLSVIRRTLALAAVIITALLLQSTVFSQIKLLGVRPELLYVVTILMAILEGPSEGAIVGFAGGMAQDFLLDQPKGITALTLTLLGYTMGLVRQYIVSPSPLLADHPRRGRHVLRPDLQRDRVLPARAARRPDPVPAPCGVSVRSLQRGADPARLSGASAYLRTVPTPTGGALLDGEIDLSPQGAGHPRGVHVRGAHHAAVVPPGAHVGIGGSEDRSSVGAIRRNGRDTRTHLRRSGSTPGPEPDLARGQGHQGPAQQRRCGGGAPASLRRPRDPRRGDPQGPRQHGLLRLPVETRRVRRRQGRQLLPLRAPGRVPRRRGRSGCRPRVPQRHDGGTRPRLGGADRRAGDQGQEVQELRSERPRRQDGAGAAVREVPSRTQGPAEIPGGLQPADRPPARRAAGRSGRRPGPLARHRHAAHRRAGVERRHREHPRDLRRLAIPARRT